MTQLVFRLMTAAAALTAAGALLSGLTPASARAAVAPSLAMVVVSNLLVVSVLGLVGLRATLAGTRRMALLAGLWAAIQVNYLIEGVVFDIGIPASDAPWLFAHALAISAAAGLIVASLLPPQAPADGLAVRHGARLVLALVACGAVYIALYVTAGMVIAWPVVQAFYQSRPMPPVAPLLALQLVRGAAFGATIWLVLRHTRMEPLASALSAGLVMSVLGGVAPLLLPNAFMPDFVRLAHLAEVAVSNFAFGAIAVYLLREREHGASTAEHPVLDAPSTVGEWPR